MPLSFTVPTALQVNGALTVSGATTLSATTSALVRVDSGGVVATTTLQNNFALAAGTLSLATGLTSINSITSAAGQSLTLGVGTGGTAITVTTSTLAVTLAGTIAASNIVATPAANGIVKAGSDGKINAGWIPTDSLQIVLRQGSDAERQTIVFAEGEPVWTTDTHQLWVGDGSTLGGVNPITRITDTTDSTSATGETGSFATLGGASFAKKVYIGANLLLGAATGGSVPDQTFTASGPSSTGSVSKIIFRRSRGTNDAPTIIGTGNAIGYLNFQGYTGASFLTAGSLAILSNEAWSVGTAYGTRFEVTLTPNGAIVSNVAMTVLANGINSTAIGATTPSTGAFTTLTSTGGFGCNSAAAQASYPSGGALVPYGTGTYGFNSEASASALYAMVVSIRAALVGNGIMS